jgi:hypothetical protein
MLQLELITWSYLTKLDSQPVYIFCDSSTLPLLIKNEILTCRFHLSDLDKTINLKKKIKISSVDSG